MSSGIRAGTTSSALQQSGADAVPFDASGLKIEAFNSSVVQPIIQSVRTDDGVVASGSTTMIEDNSIPQITEGDEYITVTITPTSATNKLVISARLHISASAAVALMGGLFQDSTVDAISSYVGYCSGASVIVPITFDYEMVAGTTSATTFRIRVGAHSAATLTFNGYGVTNQVGGGTMNSFIKVTEVLQ